MADHAHSTGAPTRALLSPADFSSAAIMARADAFAAEHAERLAAQPPAADPRTADELLAEIATEIDREEGERADPLLSTDLIVVADKIADHARALHLRRQLAQATEHGIALLAALDLPRLVTPDFVPLDPSAVGDALDLAISALDATDDDPDLEDGEDDEFTGDDESSLGWREALAQLDLGHGSDDGEHTLGAPEAHPFVPQFSHFHRCGDGRQLMWAQGSRQDGEGEAEPGYDLACDDDELDGAGEVDAEPSIGWPEDFTARVSTRLEASFDAEADDADLEPDGERMIVRRPLGLCEPPARDLVARAKAMRSGIALQVDKFSRPWLSADRVFGLHVEGDCCAPHILSHGSVHVDKDATPEAGDFVAFWFEAERAGRPVLIGWVKRLVIGFPPGMRWPFRAAPNAELLPVLMVESLNPPRRYRIDVDKVHALFKIVAVVPPIEAIAARQRMPVARR